MARIVRRIEVGLALQRNLRMQTWAVLYQNDYTQSRIFTAIVNALREKESTLGRMLLEVTLDLHPHVGRTRYML